MKIITFVGGGLILGAVFALFSIHTGFSTGWIGALALLVWVVVVKRRWNALRNKSAAEPGAPEQVLWIQTAGTCLILGHLIATLAHTKIDLHVGQGNTLAIDSWILFAALILAYLLFRKQYREKDERDAIIEARGIKAGYTALLIFLAILSASLGFAPPIKMIWLTHFTLGNILIALMITSYLVQLVVRLLAYGTSVNQGHDEGTLQ